MTIFEIKNLAKDTGAKTGYRNICLTCRNTQARLARAKRGDANRPRGNVKSDKFKRDLIRSVKDKPCTDCKISYPYYVMDLDHLPQYQKSFQLSLWINHSLEEVKAEILKCEPVCSNCHRIRTYQRRQ